MTYSQTFNGTLRFANAHRLEAGLDALAGYHDPREEKAVMIGDLEIDGLDVRVDYDNMCFPRRCRSARAARFVSSRRTIRPSVR